MKLIIGNDHAAVNLKIKLLKYLTECGHEMINIGTDSDESVHYPEYAKKASEMLISGEADAAILLCGTGVGMAMAANKVRGIRAALCADPVTARLAREHNNANVITMGARIVGPEMAKAILDAWLAAEFLGGRHRIRTDMVDEL